MAQRTILIADDDLLVRTLLKDALAPGGYQVIEAKDGREAVRKFKADRPDLVMIDLMMPNQSGIEALSEIRAFDPKSRILVVSSLEAEGLMSSALESGAMGYVVKPFHPMEISDAVKRALEQSHA